jgi:hypothetical protein
MAVASRVTMSSNRQRRQPGDARLPTRAARCCAPALLALAIALGWGCAVRDQSPREPFLVPPAAAAGPAAPAPPTFDVLEQWHWRDTVADAIGSLPAQGTGDNRWLGLHPASAFRVVHGHCPDCRTPEAALWYFRDEVIAVPEPALPITAIDPPADGPSHPSVLWIGAPEVIEGARLAEDARTLAVNGSDIPLALTPQIPTNFSYADHSTVRFFRQRTIRARGAMRAGNDRETFVARMLWPEDARIDSRSLVLEPLVENEMLSTLIEAQTAGTGGAFPARLLFERLDEGPRQWAGKPVLALVLSGAQGDDDGARGGHLAVATGVFGPRGEWHDWIADNFYPIADVSPKGIIPASVPLDKYLMDLNSGQLYYRPGYMLVAVLRDARVATDIHVALQQTMLAYYCQAFEFDRAAFNSTAMTMDPIRGLGWRIPRTGPTSRLLGMLAAPVATVARFSFTAGRSVFSGFTAETSRMMPRAAFEVAGHDLLHLASRGAGEADLTPFERRLAEDVEAVVFVRLPQIPSERRTGTFPARSLLAYGVQVFTAPTGRERGPETGTRELPEALAASCQVEPPAGIER